MTMTVNQPRSKRRPGAGSASWLALVAATSLGIAHAETVRAEVKLTSDDALENGGRYRLIVQSYDKLDRASFIPRSVRPRASAQRAVTADDLARGIRIDLIELSEKEGADGQGVVVAWVEPGEANLEFDARRARPTPGSLFGIAESSPDGQSSVEIVLDRRLRNA
jgi:hypothetical protein